jgi:PHP family Zn ribbon phosphoesterase
LACSADELILSPVSELEAIDPVIEAPETRRYLPVQPLVELIEIIGKGALHTDVVKEILNRIPVTELGDYKRLTDPNHLP